MFSQNLFAESWNVSSGPWHPLPAPVERRLGGSGNQASSLEVSAKLEPGTRWRSQDRNDVERLRPPTPDSGCGPWQWSYRWVGKNVEVTATWESKKPLLLSLREPSWWTGEGIPQPQDNLLFKHQRRTFHQVPPHHAARGQEGDLPHLSPESPEREQRRGGTEPRQQWARTSDSCDLVSIPNFKREKPWTSCFTTLFINLYLPHKVAMKTKIQ